MASQQFYAGPEDRGFFNTSYSPHANETLDTIEDFFAKLWTTMSGVHYEKD